MKTQVAALVLAALLLSTNASAHSVLEYPVPRAGSDPGNTTGPCGTYAISTPTVLQVGTTLNLTWKETIHHSGNFQFYLAPVTVTATSNTTALPLGMPSPQPSPAPFYAVPQTFTDTNVPHQYSAQITLPSTPGTYTLQLYQVNSDPVGGATYPVGQANTVYYYSCADIMLSQTAPSPTPTATPSPSPSPNACTTTTTTTPPLAPTFANVNQYIIQPNCIGCHATATTTNQDTQFSDYAGVFATVNIADPIHSLIYELTNEGPAGGGMPEGGTALSPSLEDLLLRWIQAGAPNN